MSAPATTLRKARLVCALLAALVIWPPLHFAIVSHYQIDPWRLYGFAMYCYPRTDVSIVFFEGRGEARRVIPTRRVLAPAVVDALNRYRREHRTWWGLRPDAVAERLRRVLPEVRDLTIAVHQLHYDRASHRMAERSAEFLYPADEG